MKQEDYNKLTQEDKEYETFKRVNETNLNSRSIRSNVQVFFWLIVIGGGLAVAMNVLNNIR